MKDGFMEFKDRIKDLRNMNDMSATKLASLLEKSESAIRMWEVGKAKPDADTLIKLSEIFDCSTDYLLGLSVSKSQEERQEFESIYEDLIKSYEDADFMIRGNGKKLIKNLIAIVNSNHLDVPIFHNGVNKMAELVAAYDHQETYKKELIEKYKAKVEIAQKEKDADIVTLLRNDHSTTKMMQRMRLEIDVLEKNMRKNSHKIAKVITADSFQ